MAERIRNRIRETEAGVYEVNTWMWEFGRGMPRRKSVASAQRLRDAMRGETKAKAWATCKRNLEMRDGHE